MYMNMNITGCLHEVVHWNRSNQLGPAKNGTPYAALNTNLVCVHYKATFFSTMDFQSTEGYCGETNTKHVTTPTLSSTLLYNYINH